jgi:hypothetical protein
MNITYGPNGIANSIPLGLYVARHGAAQNYALIVGEKEFTIEPRNYSAAELAELLSAQFSRVPEYLTVDDFASLPNQLQTLSDSYFPLGCAPVEDPGRGFIWNKAFASQAPIQSEYRTIYVPGTLITIYWQTYPQKIKFNSNQTVTSVNYETGEINFTPGVPNDGAPTELRDIYMRLRNPTNITFYNQHSNPNNNNDSFTLTDPAFFGANQFGFEYNVNGNGKFQISIMHTSLYKADTDNTTVINAKPFNASQDLYYEDTRTGVFFTQLEPAELWRDILGFDLETLIVRDGAPGSKVLETGLSRGVNITANYLGLDALIASTRTNGKIPTEAYEYETTLTQPILAPATFLSQDLGYYLLEISAIPSNYDTEQKPISGVLQICSNNYDQNGLITVYGESSILFTNQTEDIMNFGDFKVRILDPKTYKPANTLGPRSTVFLQIIKA